MPLGQSPLFAHLGDAHRILVAGAGGGCDVYCGIPLYLALRERGLDHLGQLLLVATRGALAQRYVALAAALGGGWQPPAE